MTARLSRRERDRVARWQGSDGYRLEFHDGHSTGYPIYVRITGETGGRNAPKFGTRNKSATDYQPKGSTRVSVNALANGGKLDALPATAQSDVEAIMQHSWDALALIASR